MECRANKHVKEAAATSFTFYYLFTCGSLRRGDVNDVIYYAAGVHEGLYGCK